MQRGTCPTTFGAGTITAMAIRAGWRHRLGFVPAHSVHSRPQERRHHRLGFRHRAAHDTSWLDPDGRLPERCGDTLPPTISAARPPLRRLLVWASRPPRMAFGCCTRRTAQGSSRGGSFGTEPRVSISRDSRRRHDCRRGTISTLAWRRGRRAVRGRWRKSSDEGGPALAKHRESEEPEDQETDDGFTEYDGNFWDDTGQFAPSDQTEGTHTKRIKRRKSNQ